jgi:membrane-associated protease RseP (regulator of RpoE activity)
MKKLALSFVLLNLLATCALSATLYTTTIRETTIPRVQDVILEVMMGKNFYIDEVDPNKVIVGKNFGDGIWVPTTFCKVKFNLLERDGNVKVMVTQTDTVGVVSRQRPIDHLIPFIQEIKNTIDGTPVSQIASEAVNQLPGSGNVREKALGIRLGAKLENGFIAIKEVDSASMAADAGLAPGDLIVDVNGRPSKDFDVNALQSYLANKSAQKSTIFLTYSRGGKEHLVTLKD